MVMKMTWRSTTVIAISAALVSGCLQKEERHIWYLDAATGAVSWVVFEHDVRSDEQDSAKRLAEEADYRRRVLGETHDAARGFRALGGANVRTLVVRSDAPFSLVTNASFPSNDELGRRLLAQCKAVGTSVLERDGQSFIWTIKVRDGDDPPQDSDCDEDSYVGNLFESLRVVLPSGHFESAVGFTFDDKGRIATIDKDHFDDVDKNTEAVLILRWTLAQS